MSLLEDVFLENEAGEAQELERIIEGDEYDERPRSRSDSDENSAKEDEAEEEKRRVDPTNAKPKRVIKNPRFVLNPARLTGPRGIQVVTEHFKDFKFKGKGHEREDLDLVLKKLEHWAYRLYPKFKFEDCLKKIETLGKKRAVSVHLHRIRTDQIISDETVVQKDSSDDEAAPVQAPEEDEFDKLLQQQIEIARATPAPSSIKKTPFSDRSSIMPKATASPSINDDQRERMLKNRRLAEERRLARLQQNTSQDNPIQKESVPTSPTQIVSIEKRQNNSVIDSSDDDDDVINKSVTEILDSSTVEFNDGMVVTKSARCYVPAKRRNVSGTDLFEDVTNKSVTDSNNIVELDNEGTVVTKAPKSYIPAKKHNKSIIESSDDDDALVIEEPITVDVDKHHEYSLAKSLKSPKKIANKSNAIGSNDDEALVINEIITIDVNKHSRVKSSKNTANKSNNVIDTSSNDDLVPSEPVTIDVEKHYKDNLIKSSKNKSNVMDSSDDEPATIDVENHQIGAKKHNRSNEIDSTDSEDEPVVMNESVTVDIHGGNKHVTSERNKTDSAFDSLKATNKTETASVSLNATNMDKVDTTVDSDDIENPESILDKNDSSNPSVDHVNVTKIVDNSIEVSSIIVENAIENVSEKKVTDTEVINEKNTLELENHDEFMDVDFTDDF